MILGMGVDLCMIPRIEDILSRHGDAFLQRVFSDAERSYVERLGGKARLGGYAKRWAAKEACAKALGTGFSQGVLFRDIHINHNGAGAPCLSVTGGARSVLKSLVPAGYRAEFLVSLSDDPPLAMAQVLIQAIALSQD